MLDELVKRFSPIDIKELRPTNFFKNFLNAKKKDVERISKGSGWENWTNCPICNSSDNAVEFTSLSIPIMRCLVCTHRYTSMVPVNLTDVYDSEEYHQAVEEFELKQKDYRISRFGKERAEIVKNLFTDTNRTVLDVGSGWGYFLNFLKQDGFKCYGIELSRSLAEFSRHEFNLDVDSIPIEEYETDIRFDIITLFGVIEHLKNPAHVLKCCKNLLKKGGYILFFTPNFESVAVRIQRQEANMIYPGQHLHHFSRKSIEILSELVQLTLHSYQTKGIDIGDIYSYYLYKERHDIALFLHENFPMLQSIIDEAGCANHMRVILQKR